MFKEFSVAAAVLVATLIHTGAAAGKRFHATAPASRADIERAFDALNVADDEKANGSQGIGISLTDRFSMGTVWADYRQHSGKVKCPPNLSCITMPEFGDAPLKGSSMSLTGSLSLLATSDEYARRGILGRSFSERWTLLSECKRFDIDLRIAGTGVSCQL